MVHPNSLPGDCCVSGSCCTDFKSIGAAMAFVGRGRGDYEATTTYKYVGKGAGSFAEPAKPATADINTGSLRLCLSVLVGMILLLGILTWVLQGGLNVGQWSFACRGAFNCSKDFNTWQDTWTVQKQEWCCSHVVRGCKEQPQT